MGWIRFFRRSDWDRERSRELQSYLDTETADNIARGMPAEEARYAARRKLGNPRLIREEIYRMNSIGLVETLWKDLRFGARLLRLNPGFALVATASLALGIGANTAIFQLFDAIRLRTLPVKNPHELVEVKIADHGGGEGVSEGWHPEMTNPLWEQVRDHQQAFSGMLAWSMETFKLGLGGQAHAAQGLWVSGNFFNVLGVPPILGRVFTQDDDRRGCRAPDAVISYSFWQREFGGQTSVIGRQITIGGQPAKVIGVTPAIFFGLEVGRKFDVAMPISALCAYRGPDGEKLDRRDFWWLAVVGRLKPGWSLAKASGHLGAISPSMFEATVPTGYGRGPSSYRKLKLAAYPAATGFSTLRGDYEDSLWLLLAIAALVLLIACANLANLMLARASVREREIAVRLAIGASRGRLIGQLLAESLLLSSLGTVLGLFLARALSQLLATFLGTQGDTLAIDLSLDWRVLAFTATLAMLTCVLFGLTPALRATRVAPGTAIKAGGRGMTASRERFGLQRMLVVSQIAFSLVLLVGALLFVRSLRNLLTLDMGFRQDGILIANLDLEPLNIPNERRAPFRRELLDRIRTTPGVDSAATATIVPLRGDSWTLGVRAGRSQQEGRESKFSWVSAGYFKTMGIQLLAGRDFDDRDSPASPKVAIVNEAFARQLLNGENPIGKTFRTVTEPNYPETLYQIIGVVKNTRYNQLRDEFKPITFAAASQFDTLGEVLIRSNAPLAGLVTALKRTVAGVSPNIGLDFSVLKTMIRDRLLPEQLMAMLSGFFAFLAALLATIGLYGVTSYMVARRRNEIGIRVAVGADRMVVMKLILGEAGMLLLIGLVTGTVLALAAARMARSMLFGLQSNDPLTFAMAIVLLAAVALAASYLPARRAAKLDPMIALRDE